jgi:hypothetical protein
MRAMAMYGRTRVTSRMMPSHAPRVRRALGRVPVWGALLGALFGAGTGAGTALGCGGSGSKSGVPVPTLASSREAQTEFRSLHHRWAVASRGERIAMERELVEFKERHPGDDQNRMADALLAWAALEKDELDRASALAKRVQARGAGTARDLALTIEGAVLRRKGKPKEALAKLSPIVSKLIDGYARALLNEEIVASAIEAKRWALAVDLMSVWMREAEEDERGPVRARMEQLMKPIPAEELNVILDKRLALGGADLPQNESEIRVLLARQLASVARERRDPKLAQHLIATAGPLLGDQGDAVAQLAAGATRARVEAPTVGLLLSLRSDTARRRSAEVAAGLMNGLGIPGSGARLASRDDGGKLETIPDALLGLAAEGAAVLVAGVSEEEATEAANFAEREQIPVILLVPPAGPVKPSGFVFVAGPGREAVRAALIAGLSESGAAKIGMITDEEIGAHATSASASKLALVQKCGEPIDPRSWKAAGVTGVVVDGASECVRNVATATTGTSVRYAFGPDAFGVALPAGALLLTSGKFPIPAPALQEPWLLSWSRMRPAPPTYWSGLGHDAGVLAWAGVQALPPTGTEDPKLVKERRLTAREALAAATIDLWTTEARGFGGGRVLQRRLGVEEALSPAERRKSR